MTEVKVPTLGESITEATLGAWLKQPGEAVAQDEPIASLETDKVAVEVPSPVAGTMGDQLVKVGDTVAVGAVIANINAGAAATPGNPPGPGETPAPKPAETAAPAPVPAPAPAPAAADEGSNLTLSPAVRRVVLEHHLDPSKIQGTGKDGRITKDDVLAAAETSKAPEPAPAARCCLCFGRHIDRLVNYEGVAIREEKESLAMWIVRLALRRP